MGNRTIIEIDHDAFGAMNSSARASVGQWLADMIAFGTASRITSVVRVRLQRDNLCRHGITILARRHSTDAASVNVNGRLAWSENTEERI